MRGGTESQGYTILEVMIFMAVSGLMFVIAAGFVNGKQARAQFRQSMNSLNADVQRVINDVNNGFYPSTQDFTCDAQAAGLSITSVANNSKQGENQNCVFMGKVIQFAPDSKPENFNVYSVAGRHYKISVNDGAVPTNFAESSPKVIGFSTTQRNTLSGSEKVTKVTSNGAAINGVGFFHSFGSYDSGGSLQSGAQDVVVVKIPGSATLGELEATMIGDINTQIIDANRIEDPNIAICVDSGYGQFGKLTIGGSNGQKLTTSVLIGNNATEVGC